MHLSNDDVEHSQHVSCLNAAGPNRTLSIDQSPNDEVKQAVTYRQLASVVKQCEKAGRASSFKSGNCMQMQERHYKKQQPFKY